MWGSEVMKYTVHSGISRMIMMNTILISMYRIKNQKHLLMSIMN